MCRAVSLLHYHEKQMMFQNKLYETMNFTAILHYFTESGQVAGTTCPTSELIVRFRVAVFTHTLILSVYMSEYKQMLHSEINNNKTETSEAVLSQL